MKATQQRIKVTINSVLESFQKGQIQKDRLIGKIIKITRNGIREIRTIISTNPVQAFLLEERSDIQWSSPELKREVMSKVEETLMNEMLEFVNEVETSMNTILKTDVGVNALLAIDPNDVPANNLEQFNTMRSIALQIKDGTIKQEDVNATSSKFESNRETIAREIIKKSNATSFEANAKVIEPTIEVSSITVTQVEDIKSKKAKMKKEKKAKKESKPHKSIKKLIIESHNKLVEMGINTNGFASEVSAFNRSPIVH